MFPESFHTAYSMVTFNHMPYSEALKRGKMNDGIIDSMLEIPNILNADPELHRDELKKLIDAYELKVKAS
jgi:hypothetical protein